MLAWYSITMLYMSTNLIKSDFVYDVHSHIQWIGSNSVNSAHHFKRIDLGRRKEDVYLLNVVSGKVN